MARVHHEGLLVGHLGEVLHRQTILCPVLEDGAIASIDDQLVRVLCHARVEVVLDHQHDGCSLLRTMGIVGDVAGLHLIGGTVAVHIDTTVLAQLLGELGGKLCVKLLRKIAERVAQSELLLLRGEDILALGRMVDGSVVGLQCWQLSGNAGTDVGLKFC